jgi:hypothetical protein
MGGLGQKKSQERMMPILMLSPDPNFYNIYLNIPDYNRFFNEHLSEKIFRGFCGTNVPQNPR